MKKTYTTDVAGQELPITNERDPRAAFHFTHTGNALSGASVWRCDAIEGRALVHRGTFTSYYTDGSVNSTWSMGWLLFQQILSSERVARWEADLAAQHAQAA